MANTRKMSVRARKILSSILTMAYQLTHVDRNHRYGPPEQNHARTAIMWNAYLSAKPAGYRLDATDVCHFNTLQKMSREAFCRSRDNRIDMVGYQDNAERCEKMKKRYAKDSDVVLS